MAQTEPSQSERHIEGDDFYLLDMAKDVVVAGPMPYKEATTLRERAIAKFGGEWAIRQEGDYA